MLPTKAETTLKFFKLAHLQKLKKHMGNLHKGKQKKYICFCSPRNP